jgi:hypothetical protein
MKACLHFSCSASVPHILPISSSVICSPLYYLVKNGPAVYEGNWEILSLLLLPRSSYFYLFFSASVSLTPSSLTVRDRVSKSYKLQASTERYIHPYQWRTPPDPHDVTIQKIIDYSAHSIMVGKIKGRKQIGIRTHRLD